MTVLKIHQTDRNLALIRQYLLFLKSDKGCSDKTISAYTNDLKHFMEFFPNKNILKELTETDIRSYKFHLVEKGNSPRTVNRNLSVIRSFYDYFVNHDDWNIHKSPARNVQKMKVPQTVPITMNESEAEALLDGIVLLGRYAIRDYAIFLTFLFTGMRVSEVINLTVGDINFNNETILIRQGKGAKDRHVPMIPRLADALRFYIETGTSYFIPQKERKNSRVRVDLARSGRGHFVRDKDEQILFLTKYGKVFSEKGIDYLFKNYTRLLGIHKQGLTLHALRRSCLTFLYREGVDLFVLKEISGHSKIQTLQHYLAIDPVKVKLAANKHPLARRGLDHRLVSLMRNKGKE
ncbi:tyrosine-type recombinase/integrase [Brevibacillus centrosporus]|uniref:tyrosine-type recombinase/integrase n=1 Tax=Brevibacillus centrosporus TaxID=54910 RepID=UPI003D1B65D6